MAPRTGSVKPPRRWTSLAAQVWFIDQLQLKGQASPREPAHNGCQRDRLPLFRAHSRTIDELRTDDSNRCAILERHGRSDTRRGQLDGDGPARRAPRFLRCLRKGPDIRAEGPGPYGPLIHVENQLEAAALHGDVERLWRR